MAINKGIYSSMARKLIAFFVALFARMLRYFFLIEWEAMNARGGSYHPRFKFVRKMPARVVIEALRSRKLRFLDANNKAQLEKSAIEKSDVRWMLGILGLTDIMDGSVEKSGKNISDDMLSDVRNRTQFQVKSITRSGLEIDGRNGYPLLSTSSFMVGVHHGWGFYRFVDNDEVFYLITGFPWSGFGVLAIYFPARDLLVSRDEVLGDGRGKVIIYLFKSYMIANGVIVERYLANHGRRVPAAWVGHHNFAHHLWNDLPALDRILHSRDVPDDLLYITTADTLGPIDMLYPEIDKEKIRKIDPEYLFRYILENNIFCVRLGSNYVTQNVAERVVRTARKLLGSDNVAHIKEIRRSRFPILWISVRSESRTWVEWEVGVPAIISQLAREYPRLCVVFDGFSVGHEVHVNDEMKARIDGENAILDRILKRIPRSVENYRLVGSPVQEAIVWAECIDLYLCHHGTLQHKVGWIANKPGVVHTNAFTHGWGQQVEKSWLCRENAVTPVYIDAGHVRDVDENSNGIEQVNHQNYSCDWSRMYSELEKIVRTLTERPAS